MSTLRTVSWCNLWNYGASVRGHDIRAGKIHLTEAEGLTGKTLCGRSFPDNKGYPTSHRLCKRCVTLAGNIDIRELEYVPSREYDG